MRGGGREPRKKAEKHIFEHGKIGEGDRRKGGGGGIGTLPRDLITPK